MREYEFVYIIQPDATPEREAEIHARLDSTVSSGGGKYLFRDDWGKRKLAYEIHKFQKGHYFQLNFLGEGGFVPELERLMRIDADVLRFLTVQSDEKVKDVEARLASAKEYEEDLARKRAEREAAEAERAAREAEMAAEAAQRAEAAVEEKLKAAEAPDVAPDDGVADSEEVAAELAEPEVAQAEVPAEDAETKEA